MSEKLNKKTAIKTAGKFVKRTASKISGKLERKKIIQVTTTDKLNREEIKDF